MVLVVEAVPSVQGGLQRGYPASQTMNNLTFRIMPKSFRSKVSNIMSVLLLNIDPGLLWVLAAATSAAVTIPPPIQEKESYFASGVTRITFVNQPKLAIQENISILQELLFLVRRPRVAAVEPPDGGVLRRQVG